jgi:putative oxidoreductase
VRRYTADRRPGGNVVAVSAFIFGDHTDRSATMPDFARMRLVWEPRMLSITRIMIGLLFMEHGTAKLLDFPHQPTHQPWMLSSINPGAQGLIELIGGLLFAFGLFTRPVAFILAGDVAVAYFMAHAPRGFFPLLNGGELAIVYCFVFLYFWLAGGGEWSLDRLLEREPATGHISADVPSAEERWVVTRQSPPASRDRTAPGGNLIAPADRNRTVR